MCSIVHTYIAVTIQLDPTSVRVDEDFGEVKITIFKLGLSELNTSVYIDTRADTATGKNNAQNSSLVIFTIHDIVVGETYCLITHT